MSDQTEVAEKIGDAWGQYREGRPDAAIDSFEAILRQHPDNVDAMYGLGLAQRTAGRIDDAVNSFEQALEHINRAIIALDAAREPEQSEAAIKTPEDDRFHMLNRMVQQRLAEMQVVKN